MIDLSQESVHSTIHWLSNQWGWLPFIRMLSFAKLWQRFVLMIERKSSSKRQRHIFCHGLDYGGSCLTFLIELILILSPKGLRDLLQNLDGLHGRRLSWEQRQPVRRVGEVPAKALRLKQKGSKTKDIKYRSCTCSAGCKFPHTLVELTTHVTELQ